jgi:GMP synthase-like glutamine amidotransferase
MILIIKTNKNKLHDFEFVTPIEEILKQKKFLFKTISYKKINTKNILKANKIIICGTSLQDNEFLNNLKKFKFLKTTKKQVLGTCAGMQIICLVFKGKLKNKTEIGFYKEEFKKNFLNLKKGQQEVYHLHNHYSTLPKNFIKYTKSKIPQAIKHKQKPIYGVLFHPEVRNKNLILDFLIK